MKHCSTSLSVSPHRACAAKSGRKSAELKGTSWHSVFWIRTCRYCAAAVSEAEPLASEAIHCTACRISCMRSISSALAGGV